MDDEALEQPPLEDHSFTGVGDDGLAGEIDSYKTAAEIYVAERGLDIRTGPAPYELPEQPFVGASDFGWHGPHPIAPIVLVRGKGNREFGISSFVYGVGVNPETIADAILELAGSLEFTEHSEYQGPIPVFLEGKEKMEKAKPVLEKRVQELRKKHKIKP